MAFGNRILPPASPTRLSFGWRPALPSALAQRNVEELFQTESSIRETVEIDFLRGSSRFGCYEGSLPM